MAGAGPVDILVNNAGMQHVAPVEDFPPEKWDKIIALNLSAAFHTARLAVPHMKRAGWGRIINTASAHSPTASPYKAAYVAAKHGIAGLTKVLALELAELNITANCIIPGYVWTPLVENQIPDTMASRGHDPRTGDQRRDADTPADKKFVPGGGSGGAGAVPVRRRGAEHHRRELRNRWRLDGGVEVGLAVR